jgi:hypothetical protein
LRSRLPDRPDERHRVLLASGGIDATHKGVDVFVEHCFSNVSSLIISLDPSGFASNSFQIHSEFIGACLTG